MAEALYRKYRPQIFEDVVGQDRIERTLKNAIAHDKVSHAYLFTGPRGTGKTTTARLLAKALLCDRGPTPEPDGTCDNCEAIANGSHPDVYELDAASRTGVENVREEIIGRVQFAPTRGRSKVYIIDEVHMLSTAAFNALLKTLEEPPDHVIFILCTTDPQKVPETIHSRCQRFDFRRISSEAMVSRLGAICVAEGVEFEGDALDLIAHRAEGGMRDALTSLEQVITFGEGNVTLQTAERLLGSLDTNDMAEIVTAIGKRDVAQCFNWTAHYIESGADLAQFTHDLAGHVRNMYVLTLAGTDAALEISEATRRELSREMELFGHDRLARMLLVLGDLSAELKTSTNPRLSFEIALTRMTRPDSDLTLASLAERVEALESGYSATAHVRADVPSFEPSVPVSSMKERDTGQAYDQVPLSNPVGDKAASADGVPSATESIQAASSEPLAYGHHDASTAVDSSSDTAHFDPASDNTSSEVIRNGAEDFSNPATLQRVWQRALASIKKEKAAYGALFLNTKASFDAASGELVIDFPTANSFAFAAVQKSDVRTAVGEALNQATTTPIAFRYEQGGKLPTGQTRPASGETLPATQPVAHMTPQQASDPAPGPTPQTASQPAPDPKPRQAPDPVSQPTLRQAPDPVSQTTPKSDESPAEDDSTPLEAYGDVAVEASSDDRDPAEIEQILEAGFGSGISFEEVD